MNTHTPRWSAVGATGAVIALMLSACGSGGDASDPSGSSASAARGGEVVYALDTPISTLDPNVAGAAQEFRVIRQFTDSLVTLDADGTIGPWLATSWEASDDGLSYTFGLRDGVTFSDGTPFDAAAVCFNFDRIADPATGSLAAVGLIGPYKSCEATDDLTAVITLSAPFVPFLNGMSSSFMGMVSPTAVQEMGAAAFAMAPVGTGPFIVESYVPNDRVVLTANPDYDWAPASAGHEGAAYLDKVTFQIIADATVRMGSLRSQSVDIVGAVPETEISAVESDTSLQFVSQPAPGVSTQLFFNQESGPLADKAVREAVRSAIDIDGAVTALYFGAFDRAWGPLTPSTTGYDTAVEDSFEFDADRAAELLDEAGWVPGSDGIREKDGERLTLRYIDQDPNREKRQDFAEFIRQNLADVGIEVELAFEANAPLTEDRTTGNYDLATLSYGSIDPNVLSMIYASTAIPTATTTGFNLGRFSDPKMDELLAAGRTEADLDARLDIYAQIQQRAIDEVDSVGLYVPAYTVATSTSVSGLTFGADGYPVLYDVSVAQ